MFGGRQLYAGANTLQSVSQLLATVGKISVI
jgi:hypothetical protein